MRQFDLKFSPYLQHIKLYIVKFSPVKPCFGPSTLHFLYMYGYIALLGFDRVIYSNKIPMQKSFQLHKCIY